MGINCDHQWVHQGLVWWYGDQRPGSSAYNIMYADRYFCSKCLKVKDINERSFGDSYQKLIPGAVPR